jgi:hypothetical protein
MAGEERHGEMCRSGVPVDCKNIPGASSVSLNCILCKADRGDDVDDTRRVLCDGEEAGASEEEECAVRDKEADWCD